MKTDKVIFILFCGCMGVCLGALIGLVAWALMYTPEAGYYPHVYFSIGGIVGAPFGPVLMVWLIKKLEGEL